VEAFLNSKAGLHFSGVMLNQAQRQLSYACTSISMNV